MNKLSLKIDAEHKSNDKLESVMYVYFFNDVPESKDVHNSLYFVADKILRYIENNKHIESILAHNAGLKEAYSRIFFDNRIEDGICVELILDSDVAPDGVTPQSVVGLETTNPLKDDDIAALTEIFELVMNDSLQKEDSIWPYVPVSKVEVRENYTNYHSRLYSISK